MGWLQQNEPSTSAFLRSSAKKMTGEGEVVSVRRTISGLWGSQPPAQLRPIYALRSSIRDDAAMAETHKEKIRLLAQASSVLTEHLVFKIYSDEQFRKSELGVPPYIIQCMSGVHMYIRKFGQQGVIEKIGSNVTRNAHSQFDILMGIVQAHILSFGAPPGAGDTQSVTSVPHGLEQLFADTETPTGHAIAAASAPPARVSTMHDREHVPVISSTDISSVASSHDVDDEEIAVFDDELELSEFLQRRSMEWAAADGELARRQSDTGMNHELEDAEALAGLVQGDALNVIERELFYITIPDADAFRRVRRLDLQGNNLSDCPVLSGMPLLDCLILDKNFLTSRSTFHGSASLSTLWLNHNVIADVAALAVSVTVAFPKLSYLSMMFNPCHPSVLPGATDQSFRQYRLLILTLLPLIKAIDAVSVDPDEMAAVKDAVAGQPRLSCVNVVDALNVERLQPYLNPLKLPLPYPGTVVLEGTVTIQTGLSGKLFASSQKVDLRLSISSSSSPAHAALPMMSWVTYVDSRCQSSAEVEQSGLPPDLFAQETTSILLPQGFTIGIPTSHPLMQSALPYYIIHALQAQQRTHGRGSREACVSIGLLKPSCPCPLLLISLPTHPAHNRMQRWS
jgi:hypothetical protein